MRTVVSDSATFSTCFSSWRLGFAQPTISSYIEERSISSRNTRFSFRNRSSVFFDRRYSSPAHTREYSAGLHLLAGCAGGAAGGFRRNYAERASPTFMALDPTPVSGVRAHGGGLRQIRSQTKNCTSGTTGCASSAI